MPNRSSVEIAFRGRVRRWRRALAAPFALAALALTAIAGASPSAAATAVLWQRYLTPTCSAPALCTFTSAAIAANRRIEIDLMSCSAGISGSPEFAAAYLEVLNNDTIVARSFVLLHPVGSGGYAGTGPTGLFAPAGRKYRVTLAAFGSTLSSGSCTLSGRNVTLP